MSAAHDVRSVVNNDAVVSIGLRSTVSPSGHVEIALAKSLTGQPAHQQVLVRMEAAPLNPSDITPMLGGADPSNFVFDEDAQITRAPVSKTALKNMVDRRDRAVKIGTEGAGIVVAAGSSPASQLLLGKAVAVFGPGLYAQYARVEASACYPLPPNAKIAQGASFFVNPLTALGLVETAKQDGFTALAQTAAASNLGQMIARICVQNNVPLVNIVRSSSQAALLRSIGARHVCDTTLPSFDKDLLVAIADTGATAAFDAVGGGELASKLLTAMETVALSRMITYNRYGSTTRKHVYMYGVLDRRPTQLRRAYGARWSIGGWLLMPYLEQIGEAAENTLRERVAAELTTTFASRYTRSIGLAEMLQPETIRSFSKRSTGEKFLLDPWRA